jgi:flotillin
MTGLILGGVLALVVLVIIATVKNLIIICPPNRVAVISGRSRQLTDGRTVGYRAIRGGRTLRVPLLERVAWMELNTIPIEVSVQNAYSRGAIPLNVQGIANVKVSSIEGLLQNSVERFLDLPQTEIAAIAKETLEANLRGVLATLTPEEVNEDRLKFAQTLIDEADDDIKTLGLELDVLKIQNVTDEVGYLESVGRRQTAEVLKEARVAEAQRGDKARVVAEQALETERVKLETRRLEANVVAPARADLEARELSAKADAVKIVEEGNARVEVFGRLVEQYKDAGADAQRIFVLRMLPELVDKIVSTVGAVDIDKLTIIDSGGQGTGVAGVVGQLPAAVIGLVEQLENATGVDLFKSLRPEPVGHPVRAVGEPWPVDAASDGDGLSG